MNATEAATNPVPVTPTDTPPNGEGKKKRATPRRFRLFDDGGGDFRIYEVVGEGQKLPKGTLVVLPDFVGYESAIAAKKALRASGDKLAGKTLMIFRGVELVRIVVETKPRVMLESKPRQQVSGPTGAEA